MKPKSKHPKSLIEKIKRLFKGGLITREVAVAVGLSEATVFHIRRKLGIPASRPFRVPQQRLDDVAIRIPDKTDAEIAAELGITIGQVVSARKVIGISRQEPRTRVETLDKKLATKAISAYQDRFGSATTAEIAADIGVDPELVYKINRHLTRVGVLKPRAAGDKGCRFLESKWRKA
jgi:DNA-binding CsgD family transcriptional regulator